MLRKFSRLLLSVVLLGASALVHSEPTVSEVNAAMQAGRYTDAEGMIKQAAPNHPSSARVHYMLALALSHMPGREAEARREFEIARSIDPQLSFAAAATVDTAESRIRQSEQLAGAAGGQQPISVSATPSPPTASQQPQNAPPAVNSSAQPVSLPPPAMPPRAQAASEAPKAPMDPVAAPHLNPPPDDVIDRVVAVVQQYRLVLIIVAAVLVALVVVLIILGKKKSGPPAARRSKDKKSRQREPGLVAEAQGQEAEAFDYGNQAGRHEGEESANRIAERWVAPHQEEADDFSR